MSLIIPDYFKQNNKFQSLLQKKYLENKSNKNERILNLAKDIFFLYFDSFETFYAYSLYLNVSNLIFFIFKIYNF